jgi:hypothetical protein
MSGDSDQRDHHIPAQGLVLKVRGSSSDYVAALNFKKPIVTSQFKFKNSFVFSLIPDPFSPDLSGFK